ncbi:MAG: hypothetical protein R3320_09675 [Nitriliruptorales bacterium]|nr:hypothetical protein [Nitriliruptorales bacterium]
MSIVKRALAILPRGLVQRIPLETRDRWRTRLLLLEKRWRRRGESGTGHGQEDAPTAPATRASQLRATDLDARFNQVNARLDQIVARLDQLDSRISAASSGEYPTPIDDLRDLVEPVESLRRRLEEMNGSSSATVDGSQEEPSAPPVDAHADADET